MTTVQTLFQVNAATIAIAGTSTASTSVPLPANGGTIRLINEGPNAGYVSVGLNPQTATLPSATPATTCTPIEAGEDVAFSIPNDPRLQISVICRASQTCTLLVSVGEGI